MKYLITIALIFSLNSYACQNSIPESEAAKAIALEPNAGAKTCADLPEEKCVCYDGIDFRDSDLVDGELVFNPEKKAAREQAEQAKAQLDAAMSAALKAMECGRSAQAMMLVRNAAKNLSTDQVKQIVAAYAPIKGLLDTGSLQSAVEEIQKIQADGVLVTDADKAAIISHIGQCKP